MSAPFTLAFERDIPITPEECFAGWTQLPLMKEWFCPKPWRVVDGLVDLRVGGAFGNTMQGPDGVSMPYNEGCFLVVEPPHRLVWTGLMRADFVPNPPSPMGFGFVAELRFDALPDGGTRYQARVMHTDEDGMNKHEQMGFYPGWNAALDQLVALMLSRRSA